MSQNSQSSFPNPPSSVNQPDSKTDNLKGESNFGHTVIDPNSGQVYYPNPSSVDTPPQATPTHLNNQSNNESTGFQTNNFLGQSSSQTTRFSAQQNPVFSNPNPILQNVNSAKPEPKNKSSKSSSGSNKNFKQIFYKIPNLLILGLLTALLASGFVWQSPVALILFWLAALIAFKFNSGFRWIVILITVVGILWKFNFHVLALGSLLLVLLPALFLGVKPAFGRWNKYMAGVVALIFGLLVSVPMSNQGSLDYIVTSYQSGGLFSKVVDAAYVTAGSPELSPEKAETNFKNQLGSQISSLVKEKTSGNISREDELKLAKLCEQAPDLASTKENCRGLNKEALEKNIDQASRSQVNSQVDNLKNQATSTPQIKFALNLANSTTSEQQEFLESPYYLPSIVLIVIYLVLSSVLALISWPLGFLINRISLK
jgi:hypothetical protein